MKFNAPFALGFLAAVAVATPIDQAEHSGTAVLAARDGCHKSDDSIGKTCKFFNGSWRQAAENCCAALNGMTVAQGKSQGLTLWDQADGAGGRQKFWCNYRVDRGGEYRISYSDCVSRIGNEICEGYGGWYNTDFGTVFGECIRQ